MSFKYTKDLPSFFLIHRVCDMDGNISEVTSVAVNHRMGVRSFRHDGKVPMVYPWARAADDEMREWIWTSSNKDEVEEATQIRLESLGYQPLVYTNSDAEDEPEFHVYGKIRDNGSLESGNRYIEYWTFDENGRRTKDKVMTVTGVYTLEDGKDPKSEFIFGFAHLIGRIHDSEHPIDKSAVLILSRADVHESTRKSVLECAIKEGFTTSDLGVLIDLMARGAVVFDRTQMMYYMHNSDQTTRINGSFIYHGQKMLSENEFYELMMYGMRTEFLPVRITKLYNACSRARNMAFMKDARPHEYYSDSQLEEV